MSDRFERSDLKEQEERANANSGHVLLVPIDESIEPDSSSEVQIRRYRIGRMRVRKTADLKALHTM